MKASVRSVTPHDDGKLDTVDAWYAGESIVFVAEHGKYKKNDEVPIDYAGLSIADGYKIVDS